MSRRTEMPAGEASFAGSYAPSTERATGEDARMATPVDDQSTIDDDVRNPFRIRARIVESRSVPHGDRVEAHEIGRHAGANEASIEQPESRGRLRGESSYHLLPRGDPELAHVGGEVAREGAPSARMGTIADQDAVASARLRRVRKHRAHVLFDAD